jgi:degradative hydroxymethylglutaryl-CoA reductase
MLIGEYAVLEGAPSIVTAVNVRAHAFEPRDGIDRPRPASKFVLEAMSLGPDPQATPPIVETVGFVAGSRKIGLGSSAAVTAAVIGQRHLVAGGELDAPARMRLLSAAQEAHRLAQDGRGSGADVAASVLGGTLSYCEGAATPIDWPGWLHVAFFDAGAPASTTAFLARVEDGKARSPSAHTQAMGHLRNAANAFLAAFGSAQPAWSELSASVGEHLIGLEALAANSGAAIFTPSIRTIISTAESLSLCAKPSGAGGGDLVVVFATRAADLDHLAYQLREEKGIARASELVVDAQGLCAEAHPPLRSRAPGLFRLSAEQRRRRIARLSGLPPKALEALDTGALGLERAEHMVENVIGTFELPVGVATNFRINGRDVLIPMCTEEASVIAAASNAAKIVRSGGGFVASSDPPWMVAQILLVAPPTGDAAKQVVERIIAAREQLLSLADEQHPRLVERGGGAREIEVRVLDEGNIVVHILVDCRDAMGANLLNTVAEASAPSLASLTGWTPRLRILSNLADRRISRVSAAFPVSALATKDREGVEVAKSIVEASRFAELDPYRATTHNKGIMNGVDAVVLATGNDWRAVEAAAHAFAARTGNYRPLATWSIVEREQGQAEPELEGQLSLPMALGVVGGATAAHPAAGLALDLLERPNSGRLGQIAGAAGLASNLAALRALATEGIQRGHMALHARAVALSAGAVGAELEVLAKRLIDVGEIKRERALALLEEIRSDR